jgi:hypothetical protein
LLKVVSIVVKNKLKIIMLKIRLSGC